MLTPNDPIVKKADKKLLQQAQREDQRHRLHAEVAMDARSASPYFREWVKEYLEPTIPSQSTREQVLRDIVFPLVSNELVDDISDSSSAVHSAQDRYISIELSDEKLQIDAESYIERIDVAGFVSRDCHNALFSAPNSLVVVDVPQDQQTDFPEAYPYLLPSDKIQSAVAAKGPASAGLLQFAYFDTDIKNRRALFDGTDFALYEKADGAGEYSEILKIPHGLPFCPAFKLWSDVDKSNPLASNTMIRPSLGLLDRYIFADGGKYSNDLKAAYANFWHLEEAPGSCDYATEEGYPCENGYITYPAETIDSVTPIKKVCPECRRRRKSRGGPGSRIPIPAPQNKDDADWRVPAGWIDAPMDSLTYIRDEVERLRAKIRRTATGSEAGPQNEQALNESQILALLKASEQIGQYLASYYEVLHKRILDAVLSLRYGPSYIGCTVNYGRRFSTLSGDLLLKLQEMAKASGSKWLVEEFDGMLQDYYSRGDASRKLRFKMMDDLDKYAGYSAEELKTAAIDQIDPEGYAISVGLKGYIKRFEREEGVPIERFGIGASYSKRVTTILTAIQDYVSELKPVQAPDNAVGGAGQPATSGTSPVNASATSQPVIA